MVTKPNQEELYGWPLDKNIEDFNVVADNLESEEQFSRAKAVRYLIERVKIAEGKSNGKK